MKKLILFFSIVTIGCTPLPTELPEEHGQEHKVNVTIIPNTKEPVIKPEVKIKNIPAIITKLSKNPLGGRDGLIANSDWEKAGWGDAVQIQHTSWRDDDDNHLLIVECKKGSAAKGAATLPVKLSFKELDIVSMDIYNPGHKELEMAFAVFATPDRVYSESKKYPVMPGWNRIQVDINAKFYKTKTSDWKHTTAMFGREDIRSIVLLFYYSEDCSVIVDSLFDAVQK